MNRAYYQASLTDFLSSDVDSIIGYIVQNHPQQLEHLQTGAWKRQIEILHDQLKSLDTTALNNYLFFEFVIPRMGRRADVIFIYDGIVFVIEFKVGSDDYHSADIQQTHGYALDLKNFHESSHKCTIVPILLATQSKNKPLNIDIAEDNVAKPLMVNQHGLTVLIKQVVNTLPSSYLDPIQWGKGAYKPSPTIIEAAQALYSNHDVVDISRSDAGAKNIAVTSQTLLKIINESRLQKNKSICFVTGVPGAGKTLVGLNIATKHSRPEDEEYAVFLSGNGPLVDVLREALARDESSRTQGLTKKESERRASQFIQNIHHFRDEALRNQESAPPEKVVIFDEAQRAWDKTQASRFMQNKRNKKDFNQSEPEFLIEVMDRHKDWCVVIALIGGGQEINTGEAGISEWLDALSKKFNNWNIYCSTQLNSQSYLAGNYDFTKIDAQLTSKRELHLETSMRSFRAENLATMVHHLVAGDAENAKAAFTAINNQFPVVLTRDLYSAKAWIKSKSRANETKGLIASSGALRLKPEGVFVKNRFNAREWFLNDMEDIRACHYLEDVATEFDIQGLELDWCLIGWDADFRFINTAFEHWQFRGAKWERRNDLAKKRYLENAYRVLLTRARQGMVIFIPEGNDLDNTRPKSFYDGTYRFLKACGIIELNIEK